MPARDTKERLRAGELLYGCFVRYPDPGLAELLALQGFDFLVLDGEHGTMEPRDCENMVRGTDVRGVPALVRVPANEPAVILRFMDTGALGVHVPLVSSADDAERAVHASLALVQAIAALPAKEKLNARVGIATGVALVGDMSDSAISEEHGILGDTPNLAARLQSLALPGGIIISGRTMAIAGPQFEYLDLGKVEIKGFAKPVPAWQVAGRTAVAVALARLPPRR